MYKAKEERRKEDKDRSSRSSCNHISENIFLSTLLSTTKIIFYKIITLLTKGDKV